MTELVWGLIASEFDTQAPIGNSLDGGLCVFVSDTGIMAALPGRRDNQSRYL